MTTDMSAIAQMIDAFSHVPSAAWAAIGTAFITLLATKTSNRHSARQLAMQLAHDAEQKALERRNALRREVYLPAAEATVSPHQDGPVNLDAAAQCSAGKRR